MKDEEVRRVAMQAIAVHEELVVSGMEGVVAFEVACDRVVRGMREVGRGQRRGSFLSKEMVMEKGQVTALIEQLVVALVEQSGELVHIKISGYEAAGASDG